MVLFDLLKLWEPAFSADQAKVHLARWNGKEHPIDVFLQDDFDRWQGWQSSRNFERPFVVSLVQAGSPTRWLFVGLFRSLGSIEDNDGKPHYTYQLERVASAEPWVGRLYLTSIYKERHSYPRGETLARDLVVAELLPERLSIGRFPGFKQVNLTKGQLDVLVRQDAESWRSALSSVKGIYLVTDTVTGKLYVGKADGADGIWGRWSSYAATGHGGNVALKAEFGIDASSGRQNDLRFSILEIADLHATAQDVLDRERHWKTILLSRDHGYNRN